MHTKVNTKTEQNFYSWIALIGLSGTEARTTACTLIGLQKRALRGGGGGGVLPIMAYTGRLRPKGVRFPGLRYMKG